jgi:hypothetical protein
MMVPEVVPEDLADFRRELQLTRCVLPHKNKSVPRFFLSSPNGHSCVCGVCVCVRCVCARVCGE